MESVEAFEALSWPCHVVDVRVKGCGWGED